MKIEFYEYLIIFVVAVVAILLIYDLLGIGPGPFSQISRSESETFWRAQYISIEPNYLITPGEIDLTLKNNWGYDVRILNLTISGENIFQQAIESSPKFPLTLKKGESIDLVIKNVERCNQGKAAGYVVTIVFQDIATERTFTISGGKKYPLVGMCEVLG